MRFPTALNSIAVLMLISGVSTAVRPISAERCPTAPGTGAPCKELCSVVEKMVHQIKTCLNQTTTWAVSDTSPMIIMPHNIDGTQGFKNTFIWRQFDVGPPEKTRNACRVRCIPRRADADTQVKKIKQISQKERDADSTQLLSRSNSEGEGRGHQKIQHDTENNERSAEHEPSAEEELCILGKDFLFFKNESEKCKSSEPSNQETHDDVKKCASDAVTKVSCGQVEGVCPSMAVLNCLAGMQSESEHGKSNIDALDNSKYRDGSINIRIERLDHDKYKLTKDQRDQLNNVDDWYGIKSQVLSREKPMVVHVEDKSVNRTSQYVIVKEMGNMMVGMPYDDHELLSTASRTPTTTTPPPTTERPPPPRQRKDQPASHRKSFWMPNPPQALIRRPLFPQYLEPLQIAPPQPFVGYFKPQEVSCITEQPYHSGFGSTETSPPRVPNFQTTELPTTLRSNQFDHNHEYTHRPCIYNRERCTNKCTDNTRNWITEQIPDYAEDCDNYQVYEAPGNSASEGYNVRNGPQSRSNTEGNLKRTAKASLPQPYKDTHRFKHNGDSHKQFQMDSNHCNGKRFQHLRMPNSNTTPYSRPMPQNGNSKHRMANRMPQEWPPVQLQPERLQPARMPDYLTKPPPKYNPKGGYHSNPPKIFEHERGTAPNNQQSAYYKNPTNWDQKTDFQPSERPAYCQETPWRQNVQTHNRACGGLAPLRPLSSGSYCDSYDQRVYPRPMDGYANPVFNPLEPPVGYTLPPGIKVC